MASSIQIEIGSRKTIFCIHAPAASPRQAICHLPSETECQAWIFTQLITTYYVDGWRKPSLITNEIMFKSFEISGPQWNIIKYLSSIILVWTTKQHYYILQFLSQGCPSTDLAHWCPQRGWAGRQDIFFSQMSNYRGWRTGGSGGWLKLHINCFSVSLETFFM